MIDYAAVTSALPFSDASLDVVLSVYGVQFAPDQERAAAEMLRVCRPGGKMFLTYFGSAMIDNPYLLTIALV